MTASAMRVLARLVLLSVLACTGDAGARGDADVPGAGPEAVLALSLAGDSLGPIGRTTPFEAGALERLFPAASVTGAVGFTEGEAFRIYRVTAGDAVLDVRSMDGVSIHSVEIVDAAATGPLGALFGQSYLAVYNGVADPDCRPGMEEESGLVLCDAPSLPHVTLMFAGSWDGPDGRLPPRQTIASWIVERVIWRP